jgi:ribose/xylose/arabinose/galactoside ABC-type transport system permease subunit
MVMTTAPMELEATGANRLSDLARSIFSTVGILPILLAIVVFYFASQESRFYGTANLTNVLRQSTYLIIVTLGQALVLISGGFDLSVGAVIAVTSVVSARYMSSHYAGIGLLVGTVFGLVNGIGVARFKVSPFIMTLGMASVGTGFALYYTGGSPVSGMPPLFTREIGTGRWFEIPVPVYAAIVAMILVLFLVGSTSWGRYLYAIGGNTKAAYLSGIPVGVYTASVYVMCSLLAAVAGLLLTARTSSGEPNLGGQYPLESITAAVIGGISLRGGEGRIIGAVLGALFITILTNGMNLIRMESYFQTMAIGVILILAVIFDQLRDRWRV